MDGKDPEECQQHHKHTTESLMILLKQIIMIILLCQPENVARFINEIMNMSFAIQTV